MSRMTPELEAMLHQAGEKLETAKLLLEHNRNSDAVSRAYYSVFHSISAVLFSKKLVFSSHTQVIGAFNREFVKTGLFPVDVTRKIQSLFELRQNGDYSIDPSIDRDLAAEQVKNAEAILNLAREYLEKTE